MNKKGDWPIKIIAALIITIVVIILVVAFIGNIDVIREGADKVLASIASFK